MNSTNPPDISKIRQILEDPEAFNLSIDYQQMREVLNELYQQTDSNNKFIQAWQQMSNQFLKPSELKPLQDQIENAQKMISQQASDIGTEIREVRAFFTYQIKDLRSKVDENMSTVVAELSKPVTPSVLTPAVQETGQVPIQDQTLRSDFEILKERFENLLETLQNPPMYEEEEEEEEAHKEEEEKPAEKEEEKQPEPPTPKNFEKPPPIIIEPKEQVEIATPQSSAPPVSGSQTPVPDSGTPKSKKDKAINKMYELAINDLKVQVKKLLEKTSSLEESNYQTTPTVKTLKETVDGLVPELAKARTDLAVLKDDFERLNEGNSESLQNMMREMNKTAPVAITTSKDSVSPEEFQKQIKEIKVTYSQQIAKIETTLNEELKKIKNDIAQLKTNDANLETAMNEKIEKIKSEIPPPQVIIKNPTPPPSPVKKEPTPPPSPPKESPKEITPPPTPKESPKVEVSKLEFAEALTQTIYALPEVSHIHADSQTRDLPNQVITTIIEDRPPTIKKAEIPQQQPQKPELPKFEIQAKPPPVLEKKVEEKKAEEPKVVEKVLNNLNVATTLSFSYDNVEKTPEIEKLEAQSSKFEELIKDLYDQLEHLTETTRDFMNETPKFDDTHLLNMLDSQQSQLNNHKAEINKIQGEMKTMSDNQNSTTSNLNTVHSQVDNIENQVEILKAQVENNHDRLLQQIQTMSKNLQEQQQKIIQDNINQTRKIVLNPVKFSTLYVAPMPVSVIKDVKPVQRKPKKEIQKPKPATKELSSRKKDLPKESPKSSKSSGRVNILKPSTEIPELPIQQANEEESTEEFQYEKFPSGKSSGRHSSKRSARSSAKSILTSKAVEDAAAESEEPQPQSTKLSRKNSARSTHRSRKSVHESSKSVNFEGEDAKASSKSVRLSGRSHSSHRSSHRSSRSGSSKNSYEHLDIKEEEDHPTTPNSNNVDDENIPVKESSHSNLTSKSEFYADDGKDYSDGYNEGYEEDYYDNPENGEYEEEASSRPSKVVDRKLDNLQSDINNQREQVRILRNAIVEVRDHLQDLARKIHDNDDRISLPSFDLALTQSTEKMQSHTDDTIRGLRKRLEQSNKQLSSDVLGVKQEIFDMKKAINDLAENQKTIIAKALAGGGRISKNQSLFIHNINTGGNSSQTSLHEMQVPQGPGPVKAEKPPAEYQEPPSLLKITSLKLPALGQPPDANKAPLISAPDSGKSSSTAPANSPRVKEEARTPAISQQPSTGTINKSPQKEPVSLLPPMTFPPTQTTEAPKNPMISQVPQPVQDLTVLNVPNSIDKEVLQLILDVRTQLMLQVDNNTQRLNELESKADSYVDKEYVSKFYTKMRIVITETHDQVEQIKNKEPDRVTKEDLHRAMEDLYAALAKDESTSGGTQSYRCLLCGRPKTAISGMITDKNVAESLGDPTQSVVAGGRGQKTSIIYGPNGQMYKGRGNFGKTTIAKLDDKKRPTA